MINQSEILKALQSKTQLADWGAIYESEISRIYNYFLYKVCDRDHAQDLTAITFERAWKARAQYQARLASPGTWLLGIARNILREDLRRNKVINNKEDLLDEKEKLPSKEDVEANFEEQQDKVLLQNLLLKLPEREHDLLALKYGGGLSNREISKVTGLSETNVGSILHRTVTTLRRKWDAYHE
jgi:RNA polymerase sigma-70 factor, ECF subfamily